MSIYQIEKIRPEPPPEIKYIYDYPLGEDEPLFMKLKGFIDNDIEFYVVSHDWVAFEEYLEKNKVYGVEGELLDRSNIGRYLKDFADGFLQGYNDFDSDINDSTAIFNSEETIAQRVFSQIIRTPLSLRSWVSKLRYLKKLPENNRGKNLWTLRPGGVKTGRFYKAWYYVLCNPQLFVRTFREQFYHQYKHIRKSWPVDYQTDLDVLIGELESERPNDRKAAKPAVKKPESFNDMFVYPELIQDCIGVLKKVNPPIITYNNNHFNLGPRSKGAITAWVAALREKGLIKDNLKDNVIAQLINSKISGLNLGQDGRTLRNLHTTAYIKYYKSILLHLQDLPLST